MHNVVPLHPQDEPLLTKQQLARHVNVSTRKIEIDTKRGLPCIRIGARNRYRLSDVLAWYDRDVT